MTCRMEAEFGYVLAVPATQVARQENAKIKEKGVKWTVGFFIFLVPCGTVIRINTVMYDWTK